ncbi:Zinc finger BED domain-containing protein 1 [Collichthys lucidus]|uniref:Zinc finger BED domain-containing protein 1 n=1 Tax=Collichthys lucidus TaxID=240159 RepID=A0A4U5UBY1_COLLU|nr:Zinc finger BED domain-containing protein 1 [Collichthys lucidus]
MVGIHSDIGLLHDQQGDIALQLLPVLLPTVTYKIRRKVYRPSNPEVRRAFIDIQPAFVIIGGIALEHPSLLGSVDGCFKAFFVFDINYPKPCAQVWEFIQACIFEIPGHESNAVKLIRIQPSFSLAVFDIMSGRCDRLPNWDLIEFAHSAASSSHPGPAMEQKQLKLAGCARPHTLSSLPVNSGHISYLIRLSVNVTGNHKALKSYQAPRKSSLSAMGDLFSQVYQQQTRAAAYDLHGQLVQFEREPQLPPDADPLLWWKSTGSARYPYIAQVAKKYLTVPGTSVRSERVFSSAGNIVNKKRSALAADHVDRLVFLANNM